MSRTELAAAAVLAAVRGGAPDHVAKAMPSATELAALCGVTADHLSRTVIARWRDKPDQLVHVIELSQRRRLFGLAEPGPGGFVKLAPWAPPAIADANAIAVYAALCSRLDHRDPRAPVTVGHRTIAGQLAMCAHRVARAVARLEDVGAVTVHRSRQPRSKRAARNRYTIVWERPDATTGPDAEYGITHHVHEYGITHHEGIRSLDLKDRDAKIESQSQPPLSDPAAKRVASKPSTTPKPPGGKKFSIPKSQPKQDQDHGQHHHHEDAEDDLTELVAALCDDGYAGSSSWADAFADGFDNPSDARAWRNGRIRARRALAELVADGFTLAGIVAAFADRLDDPDVITHPYGLLHYRLERLAEDGNPDDYQPGSLPDYDPDVYQHLPTIHRAPSALVDLADASFVGPSNVWADIADADHDAAKRAARRRATVEADRHQGPTRTGAAMARAALAAATHGRREASATVAVPDPAELDRIEPPTPTPPPTAPAEPYDPARLAEYAIAARRAVIANARGEADRLFGQTASHARTLTATLRASRDDDRARTLTDATAAALAAYGTWWANPCTTTARPLAVALTRLTV